MPIETYSVWQHIVHWITSSELVMYKNCCFLFLSWDSEQFMYTVCTELVILLTYYGLVDARVSASEKDLPVSISICLLELVDLAWSPLSKIDF